MVFGFAPTGPLDISTDAARYKPGRPVEILLKSRLQSGQVRLSFYHDGQTVGSPVSLKVTDGQALYEWSPPTQDGAGYLAVAELGADKASCGIDVSSDWTMYPRYGYLSHFGPELKDSAAEIIGELNRFHIDGLQFYDWQWRHQRPLSPDPTWHDIANRLTSADTIKAFIAEAHRENIACMSYNLGYGAVDGSDADGVSRRWGLFDDPQAKKQYSLKMPDGWATKSLDLYDPGNLGWQRYLFGQETAAIRAFGFDGWHVDQLGDPGIKYTAAGEPVELRLRLAQLIRGAKDSVPGKLIFNNVASYGQAEALGGPTDAMYTEVWNGKEELSYADLQKVVVRSRATGKAAIVAAYMDYERAKQGDGPFNMPGVLLTDAVVFASGGFHLELGDGHFMLDHEYFPNRNLKPGQDLLDSLRRYYDFAVAYEDLLSNVSVQPEELPVSLPDTSWSQDGQAGSVWCFARRSGRRKIVHLINLFNAQDNLWRDADGLRRPPAELKRVKVQVPSHGFTRAWVASPDDGLGLPMALPIQDGVVTIPRLQYWTMLVLEP